MNLKLAYSTNQIFKFKNGVKILAVISENSNKNSQKKSTPKKRGTEFDRAALGKDFWIWNNVVIW